ncbi:hypothetical protein [Micromonospora aurantiaca (nom. illeg.)]|uniref:hypothetical protein n=1 Tax=Micromonospora aurantiaca (nom. illeg.) TaxID=47850 RepID=UPI0037995372
MFNDRPRLGLAVRVRSFLRFVILVMTAGPDELPMLLHTRPGYWRFAHVLRRGRLSVAARLLRAGYNARRSRDDAAGVAGLFRATAWPSLTALVALAAVELIAIGFHHLAVPSSNRLVRLVGNLLSWLGTPVPPEKFEGMFTAITGAGVGALALYFAGVGVVAATVYADVPGRVRGLFVAERSSRAYTQALVVLVVWCIAVLGMRIGSYQPHRLSLFMIVGVAVLAVINLVHLGRRVFNFFDPVALSRELPAGFLNNVRAVRADSGRSGDPVFQVAYQRAADLYLTTLRQIVELATRSGRQAEPASLLTLVGRIDDLWAAYVAEKCRIPRDSGWFERVPAHADWLRSDHLRTSMALATSTDVRATLAADRMWVERRLLRMLGVLSDALAASEDPALAYQVVGRLTARAESLARMGAVAEALQAMRAVGRIVDTFSESTAAMAEQTLGPLEVPARNVLGALAVADEEGRGAAAMVIGLVEWAEVALDRRTFAGRVHRAVRSRSDRYQAGLPDCLLDPLEQLANSLRFERAVERRVVTPDWFVEQVVAKAAVDHLAESLDAILRLAGEVVNRAEKLTGDGHVVLAATVTGRGLELCDKLLSHLPRAATVLSEATTNYCRDPDPLWPADPVPAHLASVMGVASTGVVYDLPVMGVLRR